MIVERAKAIVTGPIVGAQFNRSLISRLSVLQTGAELISLRETAEGLGITRIESQNEPEFSFGALVVSFRRLDKAHDDVDRFQLIVQLDGSTAGRKCAIDELRI